MWTASKHYKFKHRKQTILWVDSPCLSPPMNARSPAREKWVGKPTLREHQNTIVIS